MVEVVNDSSADSTVDEVAFVERDKDLFHNFTHMQSGHKFSYLLFSDSPIAIVIKASYQTVGHEWRVHMCRCGGLRVTTGTSCVSYASTDFLLSLTASFSWYRSVAVNVIILDGWTLSQIRASATCMAARTRGLNSASDVADDVEPGRLGLRVCD